MLQILPQEIIYILFESLPITDKRNFTRCNHHLYTINKLIDNYQNKLLLLIKKEYMYVPSKLSPNEKYVIELICDKYEHLLPIASICKENQLCSQSTPFMYFFCAVNKFFKILKQLLIFDKNHGKYITYGAAFGGHLDVLKWARKNDCEWDSWTCHRAAVNGHLHVLKWISENGCKWDSRTCAYAAQNGHLNVLKWARKNGCGWDSWTCHCAAKNGHLDVLEWARENGAE